MLPENTLQSEWDPILIVPIMHEYAWVRQHKNMLQIKLQSGYVVNLDAKAIPQLIKILSRLENKLDTLAQMRYNKALERIQCQKLP